MKKQPIDWRDPDYMNKRNQYILYICIINNRFTINRTVR